MPKDPNRDTLPPEPPRPKRGTTPLAGTVPIQRVVDARVGSHIHQPLERERDGVTRIPGVPELRTPELVAAAPTVPAAAHTAQTIRIDSEWEVSSTSLPPPSSDPREAQIAALRRRAEQAETDAAIGRLLRRVFNNKKLWAGIVALLGTGGGGFWLNQASKPVEKPPEYVTKEALAEALKTHHDKQHARAINAAARLAKCVLKQQDQGFKMLLPAPDRAGSALKPEPYDNVCRDLAERTRLLTVPGELDTSDADE